MPYSALGAVMTSDVVERAKLNSFRFVAVNIAQFIVGGFTLTFGRKIRRSRSQQAARLGNHHEHLGHSVFGSVSDYLLHNQRTCFNRSRRKKSSPKQDFLALLKNNPWKVMFFMTLVHFCILSFRGGALYNYYHYYADKTALFDWVQSLGLTAAPLVPGAPAPGGILEWLGYIVHADKSDLANSNVADVANSIINMLGTGITIIVILLSPSLSRKYGKKGRGYLRFCARRHWFAGVLRAKSRECLGHACFDGFDCNRLRADHSVDLGHLRGRGGLFRMENRTPLHGHCLCDHRFRAEMRLGAWLCVVSLDHGRLFQLRHKANSDGANFGRFSRMQQHRHRNPFRHLHAIVNRLSD